MIDLAPNLDAAIANNPCPQPISMTCLLFII